MISLRQYAQSLYKFADEGTVAHVTETVLKPLGLPHNSADSTLDEQRPPSPYFCVFATPPAVTNARFTGWGISEKAQAACGEEMPPSRSLSYQKDTMDRIGLPFCMCVRPAACEGLSEWPPLLQDCTKNVAESIREQGRDNVEDNKEEVAAMPVIVVVDTGCGEAVLRGADVFVPGITSASAHFSEGQQVVLGVYVEKSAVFAVNSPDEDGSSATTQSSILRFKHAVGFALPASVLSTSVRTLGVPVVEDGTTRCLVIVGEGTARMDRRTVLARGARGVAVEVTWTPQLQPSQAKLKRLLRTSNGEVSTSEAESRLFLQNYSSMVPVQLLANRLASWPRTAEKPLMLLDACAAPGGKTSLLLSLVGGAGGPDRGDSPHVDELRLVCCERSRPRYMALVALLQSHFPSANEDSCPAPLLARSLCALRTDVNKLSKAFTELSGDPTPVFDGILLDPPCTGLGLRPRLQPHPFTCKLIEDHADYQRALFRRCLQYLAREGPAVESAGEESHKASSRRPTLVYSTCTITLEENEANFLHFLEANPSLRLARASTPEEVALCRVESASGFKDGKRFLLEDEIMRIQSEREGTAIRADASDDETQVLPPPVLVLRFMPRASHTACGLMEDSVGFFVAVFEVW